MARTQAENYEEIRRRILDRTAAVFAEKGYANTSIADLAAANGVSRGLLYHYFASKEALLGEMLNAHLDMMLAAVRAAAGRRGTPETRFHRTIRTIVRINAESQALQVVLLHDLQNLGREDRKAIVEKQREIVAVVRELIEACDRHGRIERRSVMAHTMMLVGMVNYTYLWYDPDGPVGADEYADIVVDTFLGGLQRP